MATAEQAGVEPSETRPSKNDRPSFVLSRWVFLRCLALIYLVAFWSLGVQIVGLSGTSGIVPAANVLEAAQKQLGPLAYWRLPTVCWFSAGDTTLWLLCVAGAVLAVVSLFGIALRWVLLLMWGLYLSLAVVSQPFLNFQWDALLLETGLLAVFYAPAGFWTRLSDQREPPPAARWLLWLLLLKLMLLSGVTKLLSGDPTWRDLTALDYHYYTQPLPIWTSWYAQQLPEWMQKVSVVVMYVIEIVAPWAIFTPRRMRRWRHAAAVLMALLQVMILATGNYGFFNLLSIVLCLSLIDDGAWSRFWPSKLLPRLPAPPESRRWRYAAVGAAVVLLPMSALVTLREIVYTLPREEPPSLGWAERVLSAVAPLRSCNGYGLFRVMTTKRNEIVIEGSHDGQRWYEYAFPYKPGDILRRPKFCTPHMPRLDWQMWFAALNPQGSADWLLPLVEHLLRGTPQVAALLGENPFSQHPPQFVRLVLYEYRFAPASQNDGAWWTRSRIRELTPPLSLEQ